MKILLTGATGYIAKRLLPVLLDKGHQVVACVRDRNRFTLVHQNLSVVEADFLREDTLGRIPADIEAAYYLIHSMSTTSGKFEELEAKAANNFVKAMERTAIQQVIFLGGISNDAKLSKHLASRKNVEDILSQGRYFLTRLRAGIILGSGSASFEIMRDLVEKLPVMVTPRWLLTQSQPIAISNVVEFLVGVLGKSYAFNQIYDIAGPQVMTYKDMLLEFARIRRLKRHIWVVPVMTPRLSSYWLYFVTSTSYPLAVNLVNSMKVEVIARPNDLAERLGIRLIQFNEAIALAFERIESNNVLSSWKDSLSSGVMADNLSEYLEVPTFGCYKDARVLHAHNPEATLNRIWSIGGDNGWYYANLLWKIRGMIDKMVGGVGLRRGRTNNSSIHNGDALDFWRVLIANKRQKRLLLFAEMKLPGEAWLEFKIDEQDNLHQTATFRPKGLLGRIYWYSMLPFHGAIFNGMLRRLAGQ